MSLPRTRSMLLPAICSLLLVVSMAGCPVNDEAKVMVLVAGDAGVASAAKAAMTDSALKANGELELDAIASLTVTVTQVSLDSAGSDATETGLIQAAQDAAKGGSSIVLFSGEQDVDIRDLTGISEILSQSSVPAGHYTKVRLAVENPRLVLAADPETVITDIQLTANGNLFVSESFDLPEGQTSLILLDFEDLHLVDTGNGKYVWTPQLRANISVTSAEALVSGVITAVDSAASLFTMSVPDGSALEVDYSGAAIYVPTGSAADLVEGAYVEVEGVLSISGGVQATTVKILA